MTTKKITLLAISVSLMLVIGYIFEIIIPFGFMATYVNPSPAEGFLIFLIIILGFKSALIAFLCYFIILFSLKGISPLLINEIALLISGSFTMILFYFLYKKYNLSLIYSALISILLNTIIMSLINAYFITPSFIKQIWTTYVKAFPNQSFATMLKYVSMPLPLGAGILHGSLIKYTLCFILALGAIKSYQRIK